MRTGKQQYTAPFLGWKIDIYCDDHVMSGKQKCSIAKDKKVLEDKVDSDHKTYRSIFPI